MPVWHTTYRSVECRTEVLWVYKWFRPDGRIPADRLAREMVDLFFGGLEIQEA